MDPVAIPTRAADALRALARCAASDVGACATRAVEHVASGTALEASARARGRASETSEALGWFFLACARGGVGDDGFATRCARLGFSEEGTAVVGEAYARARAVAVERRTSSGERYDGLAWRLDGVVASRASLVEGEAKYLMELRRLRESVEGEGGRGRTLFEIDYQTLKALRDECESALAASSGAHAVRLAKYVRRPKT